jgi:diadenylate cyclase
MSIWTAPLISGLPQLSLQALADIGVTAFLIYQFLMMLRGRRAASVLGGLAVLVGIYFASVYFGLELLRRVLATIAPYSVFGLIVMFNTELRMALSRLGQGGWFSSSSRLERREFVEEILMALETFQHRKVGALIVIERDLGLRTFIESGVPMDAVISRELLLAIFEPDAALHDGGVIIQNGRIAAAACFLPLSTNSSLLATVGTRHRAGLGITEDTDCISIIVSEETGQVSIAAFDEIERGLTMQQVRHRMELHFGWTGPRAERKLKPGAPMPATLVGETPEPVQGADR